MNKRVFVHSGYGVTNLLSTMTFTDIGITEYQG